MKVWIDRDSYYLFDLGHESVYGQATVELPPEVVERHKRVMLELEELQEIIKKAWYEAQGYTRAVRPSKPIS